MKINTLLVQYIKWDTVIWIKSVPKVDMNIIWCSIRNRTLGPLEGQGGYSAVHIPARPIAPIGTQWHVFYLPLSLNTISLCVKKVRNLRVPTKRSRDILLQAKGITLIESTQIRCFSRWSGGGGWSSRAKLSGGQESLDYGPRDCSVANQVSNSQDSQTGVQWVKEKSYSHDIFTKRKRAKGSSTLKH